MEGEASNKIHSSICSRDKTIPFLIIENTTVAQISFEGKFSSQTKQTKLNQPSLPHLPLM
jgi:hypothetical protein